MSWSWIVGIVLIVIGISVFEWWRKKKRVEDLTTMARQLGLAYSARDMSGLLGWPFALFSKGEGRAIENVLSGTWQGMELQEFDYWYYEESTDGEGGRSKTYYRFSCAIGWVQADCPGLAATRENFLSRAAGAVGFQDIQFELEEFNRAFNVRGQDRKFAFDFLDARMMQYLLSAGSTFNYEVVGRAILVYCQRLEPLALTPLLGTLKGFHDTVPRVVYELYGAGGETKPGQIT